MTLMSIVSIGILLLTFSCDAAKLPGNDSSVERQTILETRGGTFEFTSTTFIIVTHEILRYVKPSF